MSTQEGNGPRWILDNLDRRVGNIEKLELAVVVSRLGAVEKQVDGMKKAAWAVALAIFLAVLTFGLSIASGAIGG